MKFCSTAFLLLASCVLSAQTPDAKTIAEINGETVVATINGKPITAEQFRRMISAMPLNDRTKTLRDPAKFFGDYAHFRKILEVAESEHFADQSPVKERLAEMQRQWIVNARVSKVADEFQLSPEEQHAWYEAHKDDYKAAKVKMIAIGFSAPGAQSQGSARDAKNRTEDEARGMANGLVQRARGGADFSELARKYSDDKNTRESGGDLPMPVRASSDYIPEVLRKAIVPLKEGQVSDAIRVDSGFYIFKAVSLAPLPYEQVKDEIYTKLRDDAVQKFLAETKKESSFKIENEEFFKAIAPAAGK